MRLALHRKLRTRGTHRAVVPLLIVLGAATTAVSNVPPASAAAPTILGYATNFDVSNSTDKECEGFEVEIEDITDTQLTGTWPGNPYGYAQAPVNVTFPNGHTGVVVRYAAHYVGGAWSAKTAIGQFNHFGIHVNGAPGVQRYSWLCDLGGSGAGSTGVLTPYGGTTTGNYFTKPGVPAIVQSVVATPGGEAVQTVVVPAVEPEPAEPQFPDAVWVVEYQASSPNPVDLAQLMPTDPEIVSAMANSQISSIAELFQPDPNTNGGQETEPADPIEAGDQATVTVTETYEYTGPVNPVDNEVTCNEIPGDAQNCANFVGPMLARQMVAANLGDGVNRATLNVRVYTGPNPSTIGGTVSSSGTADANPGEIDCGSSCFTAVDSGTSVHLTATPEPGYHLQGWSGGCAGTATTCDVAVSGLTSVAATFMPDATTVFVADAATYEGKVGTTHAMKFKVVLSEPRAAKTTVHYTSSDGTAASGSDYVAKSGTVSIAAGKTSATVSITVAGDDSAEGLESIDLGIDSVTGAAQGTTTAVGSILDDDSAANPSVSVGDASIVEGNGGTQNAVFTVTLNTPLAASTPIEYETAPGTASAGSDYVAKAGTVSIPAGAVTTKVSIPIKGDTVAEGTETFKFKVAGTGASGVATDRDVATGKVIDDDNAPVVGVSIGDSTVIEGDAGQKTVTLTLTLSSTQVTTTTVRYHTVDDTAVADGDYAAKTGTVNILAGKTTGVITVLVNGDTNPEVDEVLTVVLDSAGSVPLARPTGTVRVIDDE